MIKIALPDPSLILLLGVSGAGKTTFAHQYFHSTEIISSDHCRALICDDENNQAVNKDAFALLHHLTSLRLQWRRLTVIDATNLQATAREPLLKIACAADLPCVAIVLNPPLPQCVEQNHNRIHRVVPDDVIAQQQRELNETLQRLPNEGYAAVYELGEAALAEISVERIASLSF